MKIKIKYNFLENVKFAGMVKLKTLHSPLLNFSKLYDCRRGIFLQQGGTMTQVIQTNSKDTLPGRNMPLYILPFTPILSTSHILLKIIGV